MLLVANPWQSCLKHSRSTKSDAEFEFGDFAASSFVFMTKPLTSPPQFTHFSGTTDSE